jgi:hypothetical protein
MKPIEQFVSRTGIVHVRSPDTPTAICDPQIQIVPPDQAKPKKKLCQKCLATPIKPFIGQTGGYFIRWSFASGSQWHVEGKHPLLSICGKEILVSVFSTGDRLNAIPAKDEERICVHCQRLLAQERLRFELQSGTISVATL